MWMTGSSTSSSSKERAMADLFLDEEGPAEDDWTASGVARREGAARGDGSPRRNDVDGKSISDSCRLLIIGL